MPGVVRPRHRRRLAVPPRPADDPEWRHLSRAAYFLTAVFLLRSAVWYGYYSLQNTARDAILGDVPAHRHAVVRPLSLYQAYNDKRVLCVGCTRGIGRGVALALAEQAASVTVVGRSAVGGAAVVRRMEARVPEQAFESIAYDMSSVRRAVDFVDALRYRQAKEGAEEGGESRAEGGEAFEEAVREPYDMIVLTVGAWPDATTPRNVDGRDRSIGLAIDARYAIVERMLATGMLRDRPGSRVLSVLASTKVDVPPPDRPTMRRILQGEMAFDGMPGSFAQIMGTEAAAHDAMLMGLARAHPDVAFIGTHPGIVVTDVIAPTFPWVLVPVLKLCMWPLARSEEAIGWITAQILASDAAGKVLVPSQARFFNSMMEGRLGAAVGYEREFVEWLVEEWLGGEVARAVQEKEREVAALAEAKKRVAEVARAKKRRAKKKKKKPNKHYKTRAKVKIVD
jgi:NAD(P)-dependent dehydrogenase (short-subunit alcohol dehydrogenase family)